MDITTSILKDWASEAKEAFVEKSVEPSVSVKSIMEENDLNREQTKRLCEATNLEIKRALRKPKGPDDVQFPLASIDEVMTGSTDGEEMKEASLDAGASYFEKCASEFYSARSSRKESNVVMDGEKLAMVVESLGLKESQARRATTMKVKEFEKIARNIIDYLTDEARATGSVDESYTVVSSCMKKRASLVDRFYKYADKVIEVDLYGMTIKKANVIENPDWIPNAQSEIVGLFNKYASAYDAVTKARSTHEGISRAKQNAGSRLRQMILDGV